MHKFKILDILHTGHHGEYGVSKVGLKYDQRRGQIFELDLESCVVGNSLVFTQDGEFFLLTTPFEKLEIHRKTGNVYLTTLNSIYVLENL